MLSVYAHLIFGAASWEVWVATVWLSLYFARATNYALGRGIAYLAALGLYTLSNIIPLGRTGGFLRSCVDLL